MRALYIMGENPMMSEPNLNHTRHQMEQLEFLVAQDLFINESAPSPTCFLPATSWAEKDGTFTNTDRRVQRVRQAIEPRGQARPDWQIICDLAGRIEAAWAARGPPAGTTAPAEVLEEMGRVVPEYAGVKYRRIEKEGLQTPVWDDQHPGTPFLFAETFPRGRGKFHPLEYVPSVEMPDDEYPVHPDHRARAGALARRLDDAQLEAGRPLPRGAGGDQPGRRCPPADRGRTRPCASPRGAAPIVLRARVTQRTTVGVVFIPFHFAEAAANLLTIDALDPQAKIPGVQSLRRAHRARGEGGTAANGDERTLLILLAANSLYTARG